VNGRKKKRAYRKEAEQAAVTTGDPAMTIAAIDHFVHHNVLFEVNIESYRQRTAHDRKQTP